MKKIIETLKLKWAEYLLEIIVIIIGVLGAFMLTNWNDKRTADNRMDSYLHDLRKELITDTVGINSQINIFKKLNRNKQKLMLLSDYRNIPTDSLYELFMPHSFVFSPSTTTFQKITNLGISEISKNDSLSKMIYTYYTNNLSVLKTFKDWDVETTRQEATYWFKTQNEFEISLYNDVPKFQDHQTSRLGFIKIVTEPRGRNIMLYEYERKKSVLQVFESVKHKAKDLILLIEKELR